MNEPPFSRRDVVGNHHQLLEIVKASWQYFKVGHGKGHFDGVGALLNVRPIELLRGKFVASKIMMISLPLVTQEHSNLVFIFVSSSKCTGASDDLKILILIR